MGKKVFFYALLPLCCVVLLGLYFVNTNQLSAAQAELASTQIELTAAQTDLALSRSSLSITEVKLSQTESVLADTENELIATSDELKETNFQLAQTRADYDVTLASLDLEKTYSTGLQSTIDSLQANYDSLTEGYGYVLNDPTYAQVKAFMTADTTDLKTYVDSTYVCEDFAYDVITHALQQNVRCAFVSIRYPASAHAIIAFNTTDKGIIYIEPQSDEEVRLEVGKHFLECIVTSPDRYYVPANFDDTIVRFNVIW